MSDMTAAALAARTAETQQDWQDAIDCIGAQPDLLPSVEQIHLHFRRMGLDGSPLSAAQLVRRLAGLPEADRG